MKPVIGFANKYYTLWMVSNPYTTDCGDYSVTKVDHAYVQNLSFSREEALRKAKDRFNTDVEIDESLKGTSSFTSEVERVYSPSIFLFGKYAGVEFSAIDDNDYKVWYWENTVGTDRESQELYDNLISTGGLIVEDGQIYTYKEIEKARKDRQDRLHPHGHWGNDKERIEIEGVVSHVNVFTSYYGIVSQYNIYSGGVSYLATSSSTNGLDIEEGDHVKLVGTTKHVKYWSDWHNKEVVRTELKRVKIIEVK